jgi:hypothetical protein
MISLQDENLTPVEAVSKSGKNKGNDSKGVFALPSQKSQREKEGLCMPSPSPHHVNKDVWFNGPWGSVLFIGSLGFFVKFYFDLR